MPAAAEALEPEVVEPEALAPTSTRVTVAGKRPARIGVDGEGRPLALADLADIGLVDADLELHRGKILGDGEQHRRLERGGDGLAGIDLAREHHAGHRRIDGRLGKIGLRRGQLRAGLADLRLRRAHAGDRALVLGARRIELGPRRHPAVGQAEHLLLPGEVGAGLRRRGLGGGDLRLRGGEPGLGLDDRVLQPRRVEPGERLALRDAVIIVDEHLGDEAGLLGADLDLVGRLQIAGRGDGDGEAAAAHRLGRIAALRRAGEAAGQQQQADDQHGQRRPDRAAACTRASPPARRGRLRAAPCRAAASLLTGVALVWSFIRLFQYREGRSSPSRRRARGRAGPAPAPRRRGCRRGRRARRGASARPRAAAGNR